MSVVLEVTKDPNAILDYGFDYTEWLNGDVITTSTWTVPTGLTQVNAYNTNIEAVVWLSGGSVGSTYRVTNRITTVAGRTDDRSLAVLVKER